MPEEESRSDRSATGGRDGDTTIPIVEEQARIVKRETEIERVTVRTVAEQEQIVVRDHVDRQHVEVRRVPVDREVADAPAIRTEGDTTIVPILEERLVIGKRLFLVEELHLTRSTRTEQVELPTRLRRTRVHVDRENLNGQEQG